uniref:Uncharacterized protein n=1 Tax=Zea mays TaxID=4577 RepID=A0A804PHR3_MAIZE
MMPSIRGTFLRIASFAFVFASDIVEILRLLFASTRSGALPPPWPWAISSGSLSIAASKLSAAAMDDLLSIAASKLSTVAMDDLIRPALHHNSKLSTAAMGDLVELEAFRHGLQALRRYRAHD